MVGSEDMSHSTETIGLNVVVRDERWSCHVAFKMKGIQGALDS